MSSIEETVSEGSYKNEEEEEEEEEEGKVDDESKNSKSESEDENRISNDEITPMVIPDKPLTHELAACCLSLLHRLGYGFSHAFTKFTCTNKKITDISILENFRFLRFVNLSYNYISDLTPLFAAEYLMYLKVDHNYVTLPGTHKNLQYLQFMDLSYNKLKSTDYINHGRLKHLILNNNEIETLRGIDAPPLNQFKLRSLETLELHGNKITSTDGLENLYALKTLYCSGNRLRSVGDLSKMQGLVTLYLMDNRIEHLDGFINGLPKLKYLNLGTLILSGNPVADRENYRQITLGMINKLRRLDREKTTPEELSNSHNFFQTLDERYIDKGVEEDNQDDNEIAEDVDVDDDKESAVDDKKIDSDIEENEEEEAET
ncbi:unnamed protein product [Rodentolepis nana]|uniref:Leucine-rich repeat-containing protein 23 n=1 Tax=Rodentolepis nana TaxID=102285 RepID=A0A0R3T5J8_RODNA|nr:unnamed protein product [Rodentolepis nana]